MVYLLVDNDDSRNFVINTDLSNARVHEES